VRLATLTLIAVLAQLRSIDLSVAPWSGVMDTLRSDGDHAAQRDLERIARTFAGPAWQRAHASRWAGQIAVRHGRLADAERDFRSAIREDPRGFEGRMSMVHLGEVAMRRRTWFQAERWLAAVEHDSDRIISTYARDRLRAVRERTRRLAVRYTSIATLLVVVVAMLLGVVRGRRRSGAAEKFGRALLVGEALAIVGGLIVPRVTTTFASAAWMAAAIPSALLGAAVFAMRNRDGSRWRVAIDVALVVMMFAAALSLALDYTWWSVERPIL